MGRGEVWLTVVLGLALVSGAAYRGLHLSRSEIHPLVMDDPEFPPKRGLNNTQLPIGELLGTERKSEESVSSQPRDINLVTAEDLAEARGIGPSLSAEIVSYRERHGPFRRMDDLLSVPGIGPARLSALKELFEVKTGGEIENQFHVLKEDVAGIPSRTNQYLGESSVLYMPSSGGTERVNINRASLGELERLPRIGPVLAGRIVEDREKNGPFRSASDIMRVSGIGSGIYGAIADLITVGP